MIDQEFPFEPLDIAACYGTGFTANAIRWGTASLLAPPRLRIGPSHVAVLCEFHGRMVWIESTTLCPHPCVIMARPITGCQAHLPEIRIHDYVAGGGHVLGGAVAGLMGQAQVGGQAGQAVVWRGQVAAGQLEGVVVVEQGDRQAEAAGLAEEHVQVEADVVAHQQGGLGKAEKLGHHLGRRAAAGQVGVAQAVDVG